MQSIKFSVLAVCTVPNVKRPQEIIKRDPIDLRDKKEPKMKNNPFIIFRTRHSQLLNIILCRVFNFGFLTPFQCL